MKQKITLRSKAKNLEPILRIGKNGLTDNVIAEINKLLKKKKLIKIKLLRFPNEKNNKKDLIKKIVNETNSELIESVGNVIVINRKT